MNLYIYKYNNYYNRIVKKEKTLDAYGDPIHALYNCKDFSPNDGVNTVHIFGSAANNYNGSGDYLIVTNETNEILSRWFIIEINFTRNGQWNLTLRRDLVVDYYDAIINAPCFIEKATLQPTDDLIFNSESMTLNKIKTAYSDNMTEFLIKDRSKSAWLVGYYARKSEDAITTLSGTIADPSIDFDFSIPSKEQWEYAKYENEYFKGPGENFKYRILTVDDQGFEYSGYDYWYELSGSPFTCNLKSGNQSIGFTPSLKQPADNIISANTLLANFSGKEVEMEALANQVLNNSTRDQFDEFKALNGKIVYDESSQIYYKITISNASELVVEHIDLDTSAGVESNTLFGLMARQSAAAGIIGTPNNTSFRLTNIKVPQLSLSLEAINQGGFSYSITTSRKHLNDGPYDMFCIPYSDTFKLYNSMTLECVTKKEIGLSIINKMIEESGSIIYDIQVLPFCPVPNLLSNSFEDEAGEIDVSKINSLDYSWVEQGEKKIGIILNVEQSSQSEYIPLSDNDKIIITNTKMQNECDMYRFCSPNFNSAFDFNAAKNDGLNGINIYYTYYPYNPYIQVSPEFKRLYGQTFNDSRGLICQGDYSLSIVSNAWTEYQLQNKNYLNSFNRQIDNMEVQHDIARTQEIVSGITGTVQGALSGVAAGAMAGGAVGGVIGGIVGGVASAAGGITDYAMNEKLRNETLDYTKDMFGYQLGNIKALPFTLSKVSSLTVNNRIFPFIEYYTCTKTEKEALAAKIAWNGMTVMKIGTINDYIGNNWNYNDIQSKGYIKGKIIRIDSLEDEYHLLKNIAEEINKGIYITEVE